MSDKQLNSSLGRVTDAAPAIRAWKAHPDTKVGHVGCKHRTWMKGLAEFKDLYQVSEFFMVFRAQTKYWKDDSIEIFYRVKA